jgi:hypothetical protein
MCFGHCQYYHYTLTAAVMHWYASVYLCACIHTYVYKYTYTLRYYTVVRAYSLTYCYIRCSIKTHVHTTVLHINTAMQITCILPQYAIYADIICLLPAAMKSVKCTLPQPPTSRALNICTNSKIIKRHYARS